MESWWATFTHNPITFTKTRHKTTMAKFSPNSKITPTKFLHFFLLFSSSIIPIFSINITTLLSPFPHFSDFTNLLLSSSVAADLSHRSAFTLLAIPNSVLRSSNHLSLSSPQFPDVLRYHVLLEYLSVTDLRRLPPAGKLVNTLYQATGRASNNYGFVNLTLDQTTGVISVTSPVSNATIVSILKSIPYNLNIFSINSILIPFNSDLLASETRPPLGLNITKALIDAHSFNVAAALLAGSGVVDELEEDERGAGITLFIPTDEAFANLPSSFKFQSLPADQKAVVLKFHVLHSYYTLGSLESIVNPVQPTLATEEMGAGSYTLNISRFNGSVAINSGLVEATVARTVFDENPVAIFGISKVLLPKGIFVDNRIVKTDPDPNPDGAPLSDETESIFGSQSDLPSVPDVKSEAGNNPIEILNFVICCIGLYLLV